MTSDLIAATNVIVACTSRMCEVLGRMWRKMIVYSGTPIACAASTYSRPRKLDDFAAHEARDAGPERGDHRDVHCEYGLSCRANTIAATNR